MIKSGNRKNIDFMAKRKVFWMFSLTIITIGIIANILLGTELDMRFTGGTVMRYSYTYSASDSTRTEQVVSDTAAVSDSDIISASDGVSDTDITDISGTKSFNPQDAAQTIYEKLGIRVTVALNEQLESEGGEKSLVVRFTDKDSVGHYADVMIRAALAGRYPGIKLMLVESNSYDPIMGREFFNKCVVAVIIAAVLLLVYIAIRFHSSGGFSVGGFGIIAVAYDVAIVYFSFVILRYPIDNNFIAAVLAVFGYSLNSTIVVFDRIRENRRLFGNRMKAAQLVNQSLNETFARTVSTNLCVMAALATLAIISAIADIESTLHFSVPMMFGVASGCYSSLFISTTLWLSWFEFKQKLMQRRKGETAVKN